MDFVREGTSTTKPPMLDGTNYGYWKAKMIAFLKSVDSRSWKSVLTGWEPPSIIDAIGIITLKPEIPWNKEEDEESFGNSKKVLRSLPSKAIEEANDITIMKLDELFGSLHTFEFSFKDQAPENKNLAEAIALLSKHFTKFKNKFYKKSGGYGSQTNRDGDKFGKSDKSVRCHECEGYRHFQAEYPTYLKTKKKSVNITLLDEDTLSDRRPKTTRTKPRRISNTIHGQSSTDDELKKVIGEYENLMKSVRLLPQGTQSLEDVLSMGKLKNNREGLGYDVLSTNVDDWYFDSGCSKHMIGNSLMFTDLIDCRIGQVTFGDEVKGNVIGKGNIDLLEAPKLKNVRLVEGLSANLISICQLCD
ncbi:gag-pol polyprotein [Cucumis melo var. makuwa]|uniref:Gag-pol polyprotein n=1 Tax=Cucumis melo var. makuwa TaxID=1194695 RepID=A0A5A7V867_CUCMM|nr:gag-pol polyprotein [Cucumis melo var. makuwa]